MRSRQDRLKSLRRGAPSVPWSPRSRALERKKMSTFGEDLIQSLNEVLAHAKGKGPAIVHAPVNPREVRKLAKLTQVQMAPLMGMSLSGYRKWEQGTRRVSGPAATLLRMIEREPDAVRRTLSRTLNTVANNATNKKIVLRCPARNPRTRRIVGRGIRMSPVSAGTRRPCPRIWEIGSGSPRYCTKHSLKSTKRLAKRTCRFRLANRRPSTS